MQTEELIFNKSVAINASAKAVWALLTEPTLMQQWMSETPIEIKTTWEEGSPILITGKHYKVPFENKGIVTKCVEGSILTYTHLSSISRLKDVPEHYATLSFKLEASGKQTQLTLTISNSPTDVIYKHLAFYWNVTLEIIKKQAEATGM